MKSYSIRLPHEIELKARQIKLQTGFSESAILRHAIEAGLPKVAEAFNFFVQSVSKTATDDYNEEQTNNN